MEASNYKRTIAGSVGAGMAAVFNAQGRQYYILEHKTESLYHHAGESQKIIVDQIELGRDSSCQVRFDESFETVSRRHAAIVKEGSSWKIITLSQTNPTFVNGQPISGEWTLNSGDEIRLSSKGPLMGFIIPQGRQSLVSSIGMTERLNLFRQQALRPYKRALWTMAIVLLLAVAGLVTWNILQAKKYEKELEFKQHQIEKVKQDIEFSDQLIDDLKLEMQNNSEASAAEKSRIQSQLRDAQRDRQRLYDEAATLQYQVDVLNQKAADDEYEKAMAKKAEEDRLKAEQAAKEAAEQALKASKEEKKTIEDWVKEIENDQDLD